jgi:pimeloyl-ACP methyl ester carboxylesterase
MTNSYSELPHKVVSGANGVDYTYRETGDSPMPPVLLQHFRGNLDFWDPVLVDRIAQDREVIPLANRAMGASTGVVPDKVTDMGRDVILFVGALGLDLRRRAPARPRISPLLP